MNHVWQRLIATGIIVGAVTALALCHVINGDAVIGVIGAVAGFWFGQFVPTPSQ